MFGALCDLSAMKARPRETEIIFVGLVDEEHGQSGSRFLAKKKFKADLAIVGEPTKMEMAVAEKGLMVVDCIVRGKAGHAARNEGDNAIYKAIKEIEWFKSYEFEKKSDLLGPVKMSVTQINAGTQHNVVPDSCTFVVDIRSNECYSNEELLQVIRSSVSAEITPRSTRLSSTATPLDHPLVKRGIALKRTPYGSPTLSDQALMHFPSVKMGPGDSARSHTADEYILLQEIEHGINTYIQLLDGLNLK